MAAIFLTACYRSSGGHGGSDAGEIPEGIVEATEDSPVSISDTTTTDSYPTDSGADPTYDPSWDFSVDVPPYDSPPDSTGVLVPEDHESLFGTESGMEVEVHSGWIIPAAFSGSVYEIIMEEDDPADTDTGFVAIYRLVPGGEILDTTWIDDIVSLSEWGSICWTGEVFLVALPTPGVGLRVFAVNEAGELVRPGSVLDPDPLYTARPGGSSPVVLCPDEGPFIIDYPDGDSAIYPVQRNGTPEGTITPVVLPMIGMNVFGTPCAEAGREAVCATSSGIAFIGRNGEVRLSEDISYEAPGTNGNGCDVVYTGSGVALLWSSDNGTDKIYLKYALFGMDGALLVPPTVSDPIGQGPLGIHAASSGLNVFVVAEGAGEPGMVSPHVHLLDLEGHPLDVPIPLSGLCPDSPYWPCDVPYYHWRGSSVFWEGDAYSAIWNTWPEMIVAYRRFLVVPAD
jgi:hypothetical protein